MPKVMISALAMSERTVEILKDEALIMGVRPPRMILLKGFGDILPMFGPVEVPEFIIDESELPY